MQLWPMANEWLVEYCWGWVIKGLLGSVVYGGRGVDKGCHSGG
jgi:hypothetical protein